MTEPGAKTHRGLCPAFDRERAENQGISVCAGLTGKLAATLGTGTRKTNVIEDMQKHTVSVGAMRGAVVRCGGGGGESLLLFAFKRSAISAC